MDLRPACAEIGDDMRNVKAPTVMTGRRVNRVVATVNPGARRYRAVS
jgi:hypothetical protein